MPFSLMQCSCSCWPQHRLLISFVCRKGPEVAISIIAHDLGGITSSPDTSREGVCNSPSASKALGLLHSSGAWKDPIGVNEALWHQSLHSCTKDRSQDQPQYRQAAVASSLRGSRTALIKNIRKAWIWHCSKERSRTCPGPRLRRQVNLGLCLEARGVRKSPTAKCPEPCKTSYTACSKKNLASSSTEGSASLQSSPLKTAPARQRQPSAITTGKSQLRLARLKIHI